MGGREKDNRKQSLEELLEQTGKWGHNNGKG